MSDDIRETDAPTGRQTALLRERCGDALVEAEETAGELRVATTPAGLLRVARFLCDEAELAYDFPADVTARDTGEKFVMWYRLHSTQYNRSATIHVDVPRDRPVVPSVIEVWPGVDWFERECYDMFGIDFEGHPCRGDVPLMRILLPREWEGFPFRKDYEPVFSGDPLFGPQATN